jgi:hypothetical protein
LAAQPERLAALQPTLSTPPGVQDSAAAMLRLYRRLLAAHRRSERHPPAQEIAA